jgi:hypothetical protein
MIINLLINLVVIILAGIFSLLPVVTTLPQIGGFDIDGALVSGVGQMKSFFEAFWPLEYMFEGFLVLMLYYSGKMILRAILGHRAPQ